MKNPFVIGGVVSGPAFCNRVNEQAELKRHIHSSQNVLLLSHRRYGKTSLILKVFGELSQVTPIYVDLYGTTCIEEFIKAFIKGISVIEPRTQRVVKVVQEVLSGIRLSFGFDPITQAPSLKAAFKRQPSEADIEAVFHLAGRLSRKKKIVFALDEFQAVADYSGDIFEKQLRKIIQNQDNVACIFAGSQHHILTAMFNDARRALNQMAISMPLAPMDSEDYPPWIDDLYRKAGKTIDPLVIREVVERCANHPRYVQEFFYLLWPKRKPGIEDVQRVEAVILKKRALEFMNTWDALSLNQRKALKLVVATRGRQLFAADSLTRFHFKTASQVAAAVKFLEQHDLVRKDGGYEVQDPIFRKWIEQMT